MTYYITKVVVTAVRVVLPSLALFVALPVLLAQGVNFYFSLAVSIGITVICYWLMVMALSHYGVKL